MKQRKKRHLIFAGLAILMVAFCVASLAGIADEEFPAKDEIAPNYGKIENLDLDVMRRGARNVDITINGTEYTYFYWSPDPQGVYDALSVGDTARVWVNPQYPRNIWQIEHQGQLLRSYEDIVAHRETSDQQAMALGTVVCTLVALYYGFKFWRGKPVTPALSKA